MEPIAHMRLRFYKFKKLRLYSDRYKVIDLQIALGNSYTRGDQIGIDSRVCLSSWNAQSTTK